MMTEHTLHRVTSFRLVKDFVLKVTFDDGLERIIDLEPILVGPLFGTLRDQSSFGQVSLNCDFGTLEWPNGADIDPAVLYDWPNQVDRIVARRRSLFAVPV